MLILVIKNDKNDSIHAFIFSFTLKDGQVGAIGGRDTPRALSAHLQTKESKRKAIREENEASEVPGTVAADVCLFPISRNFPLPFASVLTACRSNSAKIRMLLGAVGCNHTRQWVPVVR